MKTNRREFLKGLGIGVVAAMGPGSAITGCGRGIRRVDLSVENDFDNNQVKTISSLDTIGQRILYYASLAPSGHNNQPWLVKVLGPQEWIICADPKRRLPVVEPVNRADLVSIGAFLENLSIAAAVYGFEAQTEVIAESSFDEELVLVCLRKTKPKSYPLERLTHRVTTRTHYQSEALNNDVVRTLSEPVGEHIFYFPRGSPHADCIEEGTLETIRIQFARDDAWAELIEWIRLKDEEARKYRDGMTVESFEMQGFVGWAMRNIISPRLLQTGGRRIFVDVLTKYVTEGAGWFIINSEGNRVSDIIEAGRRFERVALLAREHKVGIHPISQYLEEAEGLEKISANHDPDVIPQFVIRVGYVDAFPEPLTLRRPVSWFVESATL